MATSFVEYRDYGYWANDGFLEGVLYLLVKEFKQVLPQSDWLCKLIDKWTFAATAGFCGCVPVDLDEYFDSDEKVKLLRKTLEKVILKLQTQGDYLTSAELNENKVSTGGWFGINKTGFTITAELMLNLINGKLRTDATSPINYLKY